MKAIGLLLCISVLLGAAGLCYGVEGGIEVFGGSALKARSGGAQRNMLVGLGATYFGDYGRSYASGFFLEINSASLKNLHSDHVVLSANYAGSILTSNRRFAPFLTAGYSRIVGAGNALNYGAGIDYAIFKKDVHLVRFEVRDYWKLSGIRENIPTFRVGYFFILGGD
jgi:hypothetical protein